MSYTLHDTLAPSALTQGRSEATLAGTTVAGRYDVLELVGVGGMGAVYRAHDRELDEMVALKVIKRELAALPAMVERFRHEVKLARRVTHVNVARTFEIGTADGIMFCTMELVEGESLARRMQRGAMPVGEAVTIATAVCDGLAAAHAAGVIHRDIKPDNVLIAQDGRVVVADFGVAAAGAGGAGELSGTPAYMAPEQARGESATAAADVYAVGILLAEMLLGERPFDGSLTKIVSDKLTRDRVDVGDAAPAELAAVIGQATARDLGDRITTARALRRALEPFAGATRRVTMPIKAVPMVDELRTIVVIAPRATGPYAERVYLAEAVYGQLLARLNRTPRVRVLPRVSTVADAHTFGVCFEVTDTLEAKITVESGPALSLRFPLAIGHVQTTVDTIAAALDASIARVTTADDRRDEAYELMLRARTIANRDYSRMPEALALLQRAHEMVPQDARITATLAIVFVRGAFFIPHALPDAVRQARILATAALTAAPDLAEAHIAMGHLELQAGNPVGAATHFRTAIKRAPHLAEAHEQLGRLLLEAGYLDAALARLDEAIAMSPEVRSARWEVARALALEGKWHEHAALMDELAAFGTDRPLSRARYGWWRNEIETVRAVRARTGDLDRILWPGVLDALFGTFLDGTWMKQRHAIFAAVTAETPNLRRRVFIAQLGAEAAAYAGDTESVLRLLDHAYADGLFDLHWLDKCPTLAPVRELPEVVALRAKIKLRADAILDALYGDHAAAVSETQIA